MGAPERIRTRGFESLKVTVEDIDTVANRAVVRTQFGERKVISTTIRTGHGAAPQVGETWVLQRNSGFWYFALKVSPETSVPSTIPTFGEVEVDLQTSTAAYGPVQTMLFKGTGRSYVSVTSGVLPTGGFGWSHIAQLLIRNNGDTDFNVVGVQFGIGDTGGAQYLEKWTPGPFSTLLHPGDTFTPTPTELSVLAISMGTALSMNSSGWYSASASGPFISQATVEVSLP